MSCWRIGDPIGDPTGESDFAIENKTDSAIYYDYTLSYRYPELESSGASIKKHEKIIFLSNVYGRIGIHAYPSDVFDRIRFFSDELHANEIYTQYPVYDSLWLHETPNGFEYWRYAIYTLEIRN